MLEIKPKSLGKLKGREFRCESPGPGGPAQGLARAVAYLDGSKAYLMMANGEPSLIDQKDVDTFLKSFRVTKPETPPGVRKPATTARKKPAGTSP